MRRAVSDVVMSIGAVSLLLVLLTAFDTRVRDQMLVRIGRTSSSAMVADAGGRARDLAAVVVDAFRDEMRLHATLMIFVVAATVLTVLMLRV
ncbi:MAG TPA: hypothetical protein VFA59_10890 [Vicinamibacterales bacterium]|nr:hypothetical protein [Vicinamibacterales bacterium]